LYPELAPSDKKLLTTIEIQNSYIFSLPFMDQEDYPLLTLARIADNPYLSCTYVDQWTEALRGQGSVVTDCTATTEPQTTVSTMTASITSYSYGSEQSTMTSSSEQSTMTSSTEQWTTDSASTEDPGRFIVLLTLCTFYV